MKKIFKSKKRAAFCLSAFIVVLFLCFNIFSALALSFDLLNKNGSESFIEYSYGELGEKEKAWISEKSESIEIENSEGKVLKGLKITNEHISHSYIIICHQYGGSPQTVGEYAKHFYDLGFNIILPYLRGHGESPYKNISMGWGDSSDIVDWVNATIDKDEKARIALFGVSMGANAVTLAATEELPQNVRLVISDSCYTSAKDLIKEYVKNEKNLFTPFAIEMISAFSEKKIGSSLNDADTIAKLEKIEIPIMFINAENDTVVPPIVSKKLYENCDAEGVEEVIISEGTHGRNIEADETTYWSNIDAFILNNIGI